MSNEDNRAARVGFLVEQLAEAKRDLLEDDDFSMKERTYRIVTEASRATWYVESEEPAYASVCVQPVADPPFTARGRLVPLGEWTAVADHLMRRIVLLRNSLRVEPGDPRADVLARQAERGLPIARLAEAWRESDRCHADAVDRIIATLGSARATDLAHYEVAVVGAVWSAAEVEHGTARVTLYAGDGARRHVESNLLDLGPWSVIVDHADESFMALRNDRRVAPGDDRRIQELLRASDGEGAGHVD